MKQIDNSKSIDFYLENKLYRLSDIVGDNGILPISKSTFYAGIRSGKFPAPKKIGVRISVWTIGDINSILDTIYQEDKKAS